MSQKNQKTTRDKKKLDGRNLLNVINTWAVSFVRYSGPFSKWTREDFKEMGQRTRKLMTESDWFSLRINSLSKGMNPSPDCKADLNLLPW